MREVVLRIRHRGEPEEGVSAEFPDVTMRSVSSMTGRANLRRRIIELTGSPDSIESFIDRFQETDPILEAEPLSSLGGKRVYVSMTYDVTQWDSISERLSDMGIHHRMGTTISGGWERWTIYLENPERLPEVVAELEAADNDVRLVRNVELSELTMEPQLDATQLMTELTPKQREALKVAIDSGYYGVDSGTSVDGVAEELGVSRTTAWEHLVRAEAKVMAEIGDHLR
jgi:predicted DNA binding protein